MFIGSSKPKTDLNKVRKIKEALGETLSIQNNATITLTELTCLEEGCPPVETVVALLIAGLIHYNTKFINQQLNSKLLT